MAFIKYDNGYISHWDETITVGSLITTYNEGYHILTRIDFRDPPKLTGYANPAIVERSHPEYDYTPIFHYVKVLKSDGTPSKRLTSSCDASYCKRVTREDAEAAMKDAIAREERKFLAILNYIPKD